MTNTLLLAGGCFWCVEHDMYQAEGVEIVTSGYSGGESDTPTYQDHKGHREVVQVTYNTEKTTYKKLLQYFIDHIDPTDTGGQFFDRGESYAPAIYYENEEEKKIAEGVLQELHDSHVYEMPASVAILPRKPFYLAEEYHQNYSEKNPIKYEAYAEGSGRKMFVAKTCQIREEKHIKWSE